MNFNVAEGESQEGPDRRGCVWSEIGRSLRPAQEGDFSGSVALDFHLEPGEEKIVRFVLAWFAPMWIGDGPHTFTHMYASRFKGALDVAQFLAREHESLLQRVLGWQEVIYGEQKLPGMAPRGAGEHSLSLPCKQPLGAGKAANRSLVRSQAGPFPHD